MLVSLLVIKKPFFRVDPHISKLPHLPFLLERVLCDIHVRMSEGGVGKQMPSMAISEPDTPVHKLIECTSPQLHTPLYQVGSLQSAEMGPHRNWQML